VIKLVKDGLDAEWRGEALQDGPYRAAREILEVVWLHVRALGRYGTKIYRSRD
jgi:hypothetical protein